MASGQGNRSKGRSAGGKSPSGKSQSRAASGKGKSTPASRAVRQSEPMDLAIRNEIILIGVLALAVFLFLCNFGIVGVAGDLVSDAMFGVLGLISYVAPALFFLAAAFGISNKGNSIAARKLVAALILFLLIEMACDLFTGAWSEDSLYSVKELYERCSRNHNGGGVIGGTLAFVSYHFLSMVGTVLLMFVLTIICIVIITEKSVMRGVKSGGQRVYERTREDVYNRRERAQRRREEQEQLRREREEERRLKKEAEENEKILRMDKKVSGVMLDPVLTSKKDKKTVSQVRDDIHEILIDLDKSDIKEVEVAAEKASEDGLPPEFDNIRITSAYYQEPDGGNGYGGYEEAQETRNGSPDRFAARAWYAGLNGNSRNNGNGQADVAQKTGNSGTDGYAAGTGYGSLSGTSRDNGKGRADASAGGIGQATGTARENGSRKRVRRNPFMDSDEMQEVIFDAAEEDLKEPLFGLTAKGGEETFFGAAAEKTEGMAHGNAGERAKESAYGNAGEGVRGTVFGVEGVRELAYSIAGKRAAEPAFGIAGEGAAEPAYGKAGEEISELAFDNAGEAGSGLAYGKAGEPGSGLAYGKAGEPGSGLAYGKAGDAGSGLAYGRAGELGSELAYGKAGEPGSELVFDGAGEAGSELAYGNEGEPAGELAYGNAEDGLEELTFGVTEGNAEESYFDEGEDNAGNTEALEKEETAAPEEITEAETSERAASSAGTARVRPVARLAEEREAAAGNSAAMPGMGQMAAQALPPKKYIKPSLDLLERGKNAGSGDSAMQLKQTAAHLQKTLETFGVKVTITDISQGPTVTRYEMQPAQGVKVSKIVGLADDIKLNLAATDIRIEAPIPGKAAVGIEVPNKENSVVALRELLESREFQEFSSNLAFAVGKDIGGKTVVADIARMPHMLIAGSTGSGKSVCINTLIMSILYKAHPDDVKLIMVDPKVVELSVYNGIPHLMIPVVTDPKKAAAALHWGVAEMTDRYKKFADFNVRDLKGYNKAVEAMKQRGEDAPAKMPQIVIIVDELADLMMVAPGEVEESICRLAQLARAAGIHLIIATQRPSVDVITGLIKANMPSRAAFAVSSGVDSRTILDMNGAEKLLGKGDMLFYPQGYPKPARVQGAFVSDSEVSDVVDFLKNQAIGNVYSADVEAQIKTMGASPSGGGSGSEEGSYDQYFVDAGRFIIEKDKASIGMLQRMFKIGFNRAARIMDQLSEAGVVGEEEGTKPRKILMSMEEFEQFVEETI